MPAKVVLNRTCGSDIFVYADPDMVKEWRHNHSAPLEFILTGSRQISLYINSCAILVYYKGVRNTFLLLFI